MASVALDSRLFGCIVVINLRYFGDFLFLALNDGRRGSVCIRKTVSKPSQIKLVFENSHLLSLSASFFLSSFVITSSTISLCFEPDPFETIQMSF